MYLPGDPVEAILLAGLAVTTFWLLRPVAGFGYAAVVSAAGVAGFAVIGHEGFPLALTLFAAWAWASVRFRRIRPPQPSWPGLVAQLVVILTALSLYVGARMLIEGEYYDAHDNAMRILDLEAALGLQFEQRIQSFALRNLDFTRFLDTIYSYYYLPFIGVTLLWLHLFNPREYRLMRNALGISIVFAVVTIALFPVAPPRLVPESGMIDTIVFSGREHSFSNEFAAVPSFHVGWTTLAGYALALTMRSRLRYVVAVAPGLAMLFVVMATGNHYWLDGAIGVAFAVGPAMALHHGTGRTRLAPVYRMVARTASAAHTTFVGTVETLPQSPRARFTALSLGALLAFLVVGQILSPGFTDFWGYLVAQMLITMVLLLVGEWLFRDQNGLSWQTHFIIVACGYADTLGTAGDLYANISEYDKLTHFAGVAAVTAGAYDCLRALARRGNTSAWVQSRFLTAIAIGVAAGIGWEVYEAVADDIFATKRVQGRLDTTYDLIFDTLGAIVAAVIVRWAERREHAEEPAWGTERIP